MDIESLSFDAEEGYIQFIRELSIACRRAGLVLSIANYVPTASSAHYNRREQGIVADYVIIMGYDEHYSGMSEAGSTASIGRRDRKYFKGGSKRKGYQCSSILYACF